NRNRGGPKTDRARRGASRRRGTCSPGKLRNLGPASPRLRCSWGTADYAEIRNTDLQVVQTNGLQARQDHLVIFRTNLIRNGAARRSGSDAGHLTFVDSFNQWAFGEQRTKQASGLRSPLHFLA